MPVVVNVVNVVDVVDVDVVDVDVDVVVDVVVVVVAHVGSASAVCHECDKLIFTVLWYHHVVVLI